MHIPLNLLERARKAGSDKQYQLWLRSQPSALDGGMDYDNGTAYCDPCHYRTAANSGVGCKPEYCAIPLTHAQHLEQHRVGQFNFMPREWWEEMTIKYLTKWINERESK